MSVATRKIVVTGATGKQGGALISALAAHDSHPFEIYAVTRNVQSQSAQRLKSQPGVHVIQGDFDSPDAIFNQVSKPWGLFAMTNQMIGEKKEIQHGKALVKAAVEAGVQHIVFTATDRGGEEKSNTTPTDVPHFRSKYHIEQDIIAKSKESSGELTYTFLRPVAFFENWTRDFSGKTVAAMWRQNGPGSKLQLIATSDIGKIAADVFLHASEQRYRNVGISLAGEEMTLDQAAQIFRQTTKMDLPDTWGIVATLLKLLVADLRIMFRWFRDEGFGVDVQALRQQYPFIKDFRGWIKEDSAWKDQAH